MGVKAKHYRKLFRQGAMNRMPWKMAFWIKRSKKQNILIFVTAHLGSGQIK